jgi:guanine deaminase
LTPLDPPGQQGPAELPRRLAGALRAAAAAELELLAARGASVAHCPTSNATLGSGLFPMGAHLAHGVGVALGSDVGAGAGFSLFKEALQAYFIQRLSDGVPLTAAHLLYLATRAGADALGLGGQVGDLSEGKQFDAVWLCPPEGSVLAVGLTHAQTPDDALSKVFALATPADLRAVWVAGEPVTGRSEQTSEMRNSATV